MPCVVPREILDARGLFHKENTAIPRSTLVAFNAFLFRQRYDS